MVIYVQNQTTGKECTFMNELSFRKWMKLKNLEYVKKGEATVYNMIQSKEDPDIKYKVSYNLPLCSTKDVTEQLTV